MPSGQDSGEPVDPRRWPEAWLAAEPAPSGLEPHPTWTGVNPHSSTRGPRAARYGSCGHGHMVDRLDCKRVSPFKPKGLLGEDERRFVVVSGGEVGDWLTGRAAQ